MKTSPSASTAIARYAINTSLYDPFILFSGLILAGIIAYRTIGQSAEERLITIAFLCVLVAGIVVFSILFSAVKVTAIEVTSAGTVDFVSRVKRDSRPRSALVRLEGFTIRSTRNKNSPSFRARFVFADGPQKETTRDVALPSRKDPELEEFVRQLERTNPQLDTSKFWAWLKEA